MAYGHTHGLWTFVIFPLIWDAKKIKFGNFVNENEDRRASDPASRTSWDIVGRFVTFQWPKSHVPDHVWEGLVALGTAPGGHCSLNSTVKLTTAQPPMLP